jgi:hypothetical protein
MKSVIAIIVCLVVLTALPATAADASAADVRCELTLQGDKIQFRSGERIALTMAFIAEEPGYAVNTTVFAGPSLTDFVVLTPGSGVYPWSADLGRFTHYQNDTVTVDELIAQTPVEVPMVLNDNYRFDTPGHYRILVTSRRVRAAQDTPPLVLTCNDVAFEVLPAVTAEEDALVASVVQRIRATNDANSAQAIIWQELDYLTGDTATAAKIALYLNPVITGDLTTNATRGLWMARNRSMVVSALERAIVDPAQRNGFSINLLGTLVALKASLEIPFAPQPGPAQLAPSPLTRVAMDRLAAGYVHQIAQSIPKRSGESATDAAGTVFVWTLSAHQAGGPDYELAREYLIAHFEDVNLHNLDWLLNGYGSYLRDRRLVPVLQRIVNDTADPTLGADRSAAARQLALIAQIQ